MLRYIPIFQISFAYMSVLECLLVWFSFKKQFHRVLNICDQLSLLVSAVSKAPPYLIYNNCKTWNQRTSQTGMYLVRSSFLSPAQSKISSKVRLSYSRFCPVRSQKHPGLKNIWAAGL